MAIRPDSLPMSLPSRAVTDGRADPLPRQAEAPLAGGAVMRPLPLPPAADDTLQPTRTIVVGMRESRALAALAADIVDRLSEAAGADAEVLRTRLREVVEIGSARDTAGPLAGLYAAARRDAAAPLARVLAGDGAADPTGFRTVLAEAGQELRALDERFAARDFALSARPPVALPLPKPLPPAGLDLMV